MPLERAVEKATVGLAGDHRVQRPQGAAGVAVHGQAQAGAAAEPLRGDVDLRRAHGVGEELVVREVGADQQQQIRVVQAVVGGAVAEQADHPHVERIVVLDPLLAAQAVTDRGADRVGEREHLLAGPAHPGSGEDRDASGLVDRGGQRPHIRLGRHHRGRRGAHQPRRRALRAQRGDVAGQRHHRDARSRQGVRHGAVQYAGCLRGGAHQLRVRRALHEQPIGVGLLEVPAADLHGRDVRGDRQYRRTGAMGVVETVDQVQIAGSARSGAHREITGDLRVGGGRERRGLLVPHVDPVDAAPGDATGAVHRVDDRVETVPDDAVDPSGPGVDELRDELFGNGTHGHGRLPRLERGEEN